MTDYTVNNGIPFVPEGVIDPAAGLNLALLVIDRLLQLRVLGMKQNTPQVSPAVGARYIVGTSPTGAWAGKNLQVAEWMADGYWAFSPASVAVFGTSIYLNTGTDWVPASAGAAAAWGGITGTLSNQADLAEALDEKEFVLTAGSNITIDRTDPSAPVISATGGGGGGGSGDVVGPSSSVDNQLALFSGTTGKLLKAGVGVGTLSQINGVPGRVVTASGAVTPADAGRWIISNAATPITLTIGAEATAAWPSDVYATINVLQVGAGAVTIAGASGVTVSVHSSDTAVTAGAGSAVTAVRTESNKFSLFGKLVAA